MTNKFLNIILLLAFATIFIIPGFAQLSCGAGDNNDACGDAIGGDYVGVDFYPTSYSWVEATSTTSTSTPRWDFYIPSAGTVVDFATCTGQDAEITLNQYSNTTNLIRRDDDNELNVGLGCGPNGNDESISYLIQNAGWHSIKLSRQGGCCLYQSCRGMNSGTKRLYYKVRAKPDGNGGNTGVSGTNQWNGYVYDGTGFNYYYYTYTRPENFDHNFGTGQPNNTTSTDGNMCDADNFSIRYRMTKNYCGRYRFTVGADDGYRLYLNGTLVIDNWANGGYRTSTYDVNLNGSTTLVLEYYEATGDGRVSFNASPLVANAYCDCASPIALNTTYSVNTTSLPSYGAVACGGASGTTDGPGVWYTIVGNGSQFTASTCASDYDTQIRVFTFSGGCGGTRTCIAGNDDNGSACTGTRASTSWCSVPGVTYYIYSSGFSGAGNNSLIVTANSLDWANLQSPSSASVCTGANFTAYGQVYEPGVTPGAGVQGAGIEAQFGYHTANTNPSTWTNWFNASFNAGGGGANNDEYQYTLVAPAAGTYYYTFRYRLNGCDWQYGATNGFWNGSSNVNGVLTVSPHHSLTLTSAAGTNNQTVCPNTAITNITYSIGGGATSTSITSGGLPTGVTGSFSGGVFTISGTPSVSGVFNYTITTSGNACNTAGLTGSITVRPLFSYANLQFPSSGTICQGNTFSIYGQVYALGVTESAGIGAGVEAQFGYHTSNTNPSGWTNWQNASFNSQQGNNDEFIGTLSGLAAGTYYYTFRYRLNGCAYQYGGFPNGFWNGSTQNSGVLTVQPNHTLSLSSGSTTQTVCQSTAITPIVYAVGGGGTGAGVTGLPTGLTGSFASGNFTISGTPTQNGTFSYTVTTTGNGCTVATATGTITVNSNHTISLTSGSSSQTICAGGGITPIVYAVGGGATSAGVTGLPSGVTGSFASGNFTISGTPTQSGTFSYTVTTTGNGCTVATATGTITVHAPLVLTPGGTNVSCNGGTNGTASVTASGGTGTYTYSWYSGGSGSSLSGLGIGTYTVLVTSGACSGTTSYTVTQPSAITGSASAGASILCNGGTTTLTATASGGTGALQYSLNGGAYQSSNSFTVGAGTHTITVKDANNCTQALAAVVVSQPSALVAKTCTNANDLCQVALGQIKVVVSGGVAPYNVAWSPTHGTPSSPQSIGASGGAITISGLQGGVTYTFVVTDANGCVAP